MAKTLGDAEKEARLGAAENGLTRLAETLGANAGASAVFGTPVERDGVTVIPVARVRWGFGGGDGTGGRGGRKRKAKSQDGWGGGGSVHAAPLGFIEMKDGAAKYRRVHDPLRLAIATLFLPLSVAAAGVALVLTLRALARSMKGMVSLPYLLWPFRRRRA